jgi:hypothetical protein
MTDENPQYPSWLLLSREALRNELQHLDELEKLGRAEVKRGLELTKVVRERREGITFASNVLSQNHTPATWHDEIVSASGIRFAGTANVFEQHDRTITIRATELGAHRDAENARLISVLTNTVATGASLGAVAATLEARVHVLTGLAGASVAPPTFHPGGSWEKLRDNLGAVLIFFDDQSQAMHEGVEKALSQPGPDYLSHAAHSMRDLFQGLLVQLAPNDVVSRQPWFERNRNAPGGITRLHRLRYILYGSGKQYSQADIDQLDSVAEAAKASLDLAMSRAHNHDPELTEQEVRLSIEEARFWLYTVLRRHLLRFPGSYVVD